MTKPDKNAAPAAAPVPELTPEQMAYYQRIATGRALTQDFINILGRTNVRTDIALMVGFGIVQAGLAGLNQQSKGDAQQAVYSMAADFEQMVAALGLTLDIPEDVPAKQKRN